ncbi:MAG: monovalent cation/H+ antiporter subunit D [Roseinatronobacter sp.]
MSHLVVLPLILPALLGPVLVLLRGNLGVQRVLSLAGTVALAAVALGLVSVAADGTIVVYEMGNWPAPFGIVMVLDRLSALMVAMTGLLAVAVLLYVIGTDWDQRGAHFHPLYQFQLFGLCGAMLTSDAFNLFVFFEVLLIASYGLMVHGGGRLRLQAGTQYVIYNLAGSTLFVFALAVVYAVFGTLNMADIAAKAATLPDTDAALVRTAAVMLLLVFALKGALLPLHFWLPNTYAHAPAPVAALFAVMTKVGAYAIIRMFTLAFGPSLALTGTLPGQIVLVGALITTVVGMVGVLAGGSLARVAAFAGIGSMGTLFIAVAPFTEVAMGAALYYMVHSTLAAAMIFLVVDMVQARRGTCALELRGVIAQSGLIASLYFFAAIAMAGMPPLSGFLGKLLVLDGVRDTSTWVWSWAIILGGSLIVIMGLARAGSIVFWKAHAVPADDAPADAPARALALGGVGLLALLIIAMTLGAGPVSAYLDATATQLFTPAEYIAAVLRSE